MSIILRDNLMPRFPTLLSDFFDDDLIKDSHNWMQSMPAANVAENNTEYTIELAVPGLEKGDFNLSLENGKLVISAEKEGKVEKKEEDFTRKEFSFNSFSRSFYLPEGVREDKIKAVYADGVLKVTLPKKEVKPVMPSKLITVN